MAVRLVHVHVKPEHIDAFLEITRRNHLGSVAEPGNLRFDVLRSADDPTRFVLYEWYVDEAAAKAHKETAHYFAWRDAVTDWLVEPRVPVRYDGIFPGSPADR